MSKERHIYAATGMIKSPDDDRDYPLDKLIVKAVYPPSYYRNSIEAPVYNQRDVGCCVACSLATSKYLIEKAQLGEARPFSVKYLYGNRGDSENHEEGMIPREALKVLQKYGDCHWDLLSGYAEYPVAFDEYSRKKDRYDLDAYPYRISSYYRLKTKAEIMTAVYTLGVVTIACPAYESLFFPDENYYVKYNPLEDMYGYHEMTLIGYDKDNRYWIVQNSWGKEYGDNGIVHISFDYPIVEAWAMVDEIMERELTQCGNEEDK